jgi:hypothetical protein
MLRYVVAIIGTMMLAVAFAQILRPAMSADAARALVEGEYMTSLGLIAFVMGLVLLIAGVRHLVRIPLVVILVGGYAIIGGVVTFVHPDLVRNLIRKLYLYRSPSAQTMITIASAVVRAAVGALLLYAGLVAPKARTLVAVIPVRAAVSEPEKGEQTKE